MKSFIMILAVSLYIHLGMAQTPEKPEDISPLLIGESIPKATLRDANNKKTNLSKLVKQKPSVIVFYRGGWCPYCNLQLSGLQEVEKKILELGYQIIAISPDKTKKLSKTVKKQKLSYLLLSDADMALSKNFGIAFKAPKKYKRLIGLKKRSGGKNVDSLLPVPSVFLVDKEGVIQFEYINPNYKVRLNSALLLAAAKIQQQEK